MSNGFAGAPPETPPAAHTPEPPPPLPAARQRPDQLSGELSLPALRDAFQLAGIGIVHTDMRGKIIAVNPAFASFLGCTPAELVGQSVFAHSPPDYDTRQEIADVRAAIATHEDVVRHTKRFRRLDGAQRWTQVSITVARDAADRPVSTYAFVEDITEHRRQEEALRASEWRFRSLVETTPFGVHLYTLRADGELVFSGANPAADRILGIEHSALVGMAILQAFPSLAGTEVPERYQAVARTGISWTTEHFTYADERIVGAFEVHAFQTAVDRMAAMFRDTTARHHAPRPKK